MPLITERVCRKAKYVTISRMKVGGDGVVRGSDDTMSRETPRAHWVAAGLVISGESPCLAAALVVVVVVVCQMATP